MAGKAGSGFKMTPARLRQRKEASATYQRMLREGLRGPKVSMSAALALASALGYPTSLPERKGQRHELPE
jgi:hypothetical protein